MPRKYTITDAEREKRRERGRKSGLLNVESGHIDTITKKSVANRKKAMELLREKESLELAS